MAALQVKAFSVVGWVERPGKAGLDQLGHAGFSLRFNPAYKGKDRPPRPTARGYILLEALIAILIFSIAMLGTMGMYAKSVRNNSEAEFRFEASYMANELVGMMRSDNKTPATLMTNYATGGPKYVTWLASATQANRLPGLATNPPTVAIVTIPGAAPPDTSKSQVTITLYWQLPNSTVHSHVFTTLINQ